MEDKDLEYCLTGYRHMTGVEMRGSYKEEKRGVY
jgi:hypothetical protein